MPQSLSKILVHIVFSTRNRHPFLNTPEIREEMHRYLGGASKTLQSPILTVGGVADHVHLLVDLGRTISAAEFVKEIKRISSLWIKTKDIRYRKFQWQSGYGAFSIGQSQAAETRRYITDQAKHHRKATFQEEFRRFLERYGIEYDERYVWD